MPVSLHTAAEDDAIKRVQGGKQGGRAVPFVIMGHGTAPTGLDRQAGLGAVERLDLKFFVDRQHHGMGRRVHVEADEVFDLLGESRIGGPFQGADAMCCSVSISHPNNRGSSWSARHSAFPCT